MKRSHLILLALLSCLLGLSSYASKVAPTLGTHTYFASMIEPGFPDYETPDFSVSLAGENEYIWLGDSGTTAAMYPALIPDKRYTLTIGGNKLDQTNTYFYPPVGYRLIVDGLEKDTISYSGYSWDAMDPYDSHSWEIVLKSKDKLGASDAPAGTDLGLEVGDLRWRVSMGNLPNGHSAGRISLASEEINAGLFEPSALYYYSTHTSSDVDVIRTGTGGSILRQVYTAQALADIVDLGSSYEVRFYKPADVGAKTTTYAVSGTPFIKYKIEKLGGSNTQLKLTRTEGARVLMTEATYSSGNWTLETHSDLKKVHKSSTLVSGDRVENTTVKNAANTLATEFSKTYDPGLAWGEEMIQFKETIGSNDYITTYEYYTDSFYKGDYSRIKSITYPDGNWVRYDYDDSDNYWGLLKKEYRPFKDSPSTASSATDTNCLATTYSYTTVWTGGTPLPTSIETKNNNVTVAKSTFSYNYASIHNGKYALVTTRNDYSASSDSQTTVTATYRSDQAAFYANKPIYVKHPDGSMQYYTLTYDSGTDEWTESIYQGTSSSSGADLETTVLGQNFYLIREKSTRTDIIRDSRGLLTNVKTYIYHYDSVEAETVFEEITSVTNLYEDAGYLKKRTGSNNTVYEATWANGLMTSDETPYGTITDYTYDVMDRVTKTVVNGATVEGVVIPDLITQYTYDGDSRLLKEIVGPVSDPHPLVSEQVYYTTGRLKESIAPGGYKTTYSYSADDRTVTKTLPGTSGEGGAGTEITTTYRDGSIKSIKGTAVASTNSASGRYFDYYTETDGRRVTKTTIGSSTSSTRWQRQWVNWRGQITREEAPAYNTQPNFVRTYVYNTSTGLLSYQTESGRANTYYSYNTFGEVEYEWLDVASGGTMVLNSADRFKKYVSDYYKNGISIWYKRYEEFIGDMDASGNPIGAERHLLSSLEQLTGLAGALTYLKYSYDVNWNVTTELIYQYPTTHRRLEKIRLPDGSNYAYNIYGNDRLVKSANREGVTATYAYDNYGRNDKVNDRTGDHTTVFINGTALPSQVKGLGAAQEITHEYAYYNTGKVKQIKRHEDDSGSNYLSTYLAYDTTGKVLKRWGHEGYPVLYEYDSDFGHLKKQKTYRAGTGWTGNSWPGSPGTADTTEWVVETKTGLVTSKKDAALQSVVFQYNQRGQVSRRTWARGTYTDYSYDSNTAELTGVNYSDSTTDITYAYSRHGTIKSVTDATGTRTFNFRLSPRKDWLVEKEILPSGFYGSGRQLSYAYLDYQSWGPFLMNRGKLEYTRYGTSSNPDAYVETKYAYDSVTGRVSSIKDDIGAKTFTYGYETNSNLVKTISNGSYSATRSWSSIRNRVESIETKWSTTSKVKHAYTYDWLDRRTRDTRTGEIFNRYGSSNQGLRVDYLYNDRSEVTSAIATVISSSTALLGGSRQYAYDNQGNRSETTVNSRTADYYPTNVNTYDNGANNEGRQVPAYVDIAGADSAGTVTVEGVTASRQGDYFHRELNLNNSSSNVYENVSIVGSGSATVKALIVQTKEDMQWDDDGNLSNDGIWDYTWDGENRLASITVRSGLSFSGDGGTFTRKHLTFKYDYLGRRVEKVSYDNWNGSTGTLLYTRRFVYDGWNLIAEQDQSGNIIRSYTWGLDESHTLPGAGGVGGLLMITEGADRYYTAYDANGNLSALLNSSNGAVEAAYEYGPSGELIRISGNAIAFDNPFRFSTKYYDEETELLYYGLRYYSASLGRFISRDPIGENGEQNLYAMVGNNAVNGIDYLGMWSLFGGAIKGGGDIDQERQWWDTGDGTGTQQLDDEDFVKITESFIKQAAEVGKTSQEAIQILIDILSKQSASAAAKAALHNFLKAMGEAYQALENAGRSSSSSNGNKSDSSGMTQSGGRSGSKLGNILAKTPILGGVGLGTVGDVLSGLGNIFRGNVSKGIGEIGYGIYDIGNVLVNDVFDTVYGNTIGKISGYYRVLSLGLTKQRGFGQTIKSLFGVTVIPHYGKAVGAGFGPDPFLGYTDKTKDGFVTKLDNAAVPHDILSAHYLFQGTNVPMFVHRGFMQDLWTANGREMGPIGQSFRLIFTGALALPTTLKK